MFVSCVSTTWTNNNNNNTSNCNMSCVGVWKKSTRNTGQNKKDREKKKKHTDKTVKFEQTTLSGKMTTNTTNRTEANWIDGTTLIIFLFSSMSIDHQHSFMYTAVSRTAYDCYYWFWSFIGIVSRDRGRALCYHYKLIFFRSILGKSREKKIERITVLLRKID